MEEEIKCLTLDELSLKYDVHRHTMKNWINNLSEKFPELKNEKGELYKPSQLKILFRELG